jgi:hypothetical protein
MFDWHFERVQYNQDAIIDVLCAAGTLDVIVWTWRVVISRR